MMLDAHPQLAIPPETGFVLPLARRRWSWPSGVGRARFLRHVTTAPCWPDFHLERDHLHAAVDALPRFTLAAGVRTFYELYAARFGKSRWGDKTPLYGPAIGAIGALLPEARFVHIIRDGRDVAVSLRPLWFAPASDMPTLARYWTGLIARTRRAATRVPHYLEVRYESLVAEPAPVLQRICAFLDLEFDAQLLTYHTRARGRLDEHEARLAGDGGVLVSKAARLAQQQRTAQPPDRSRVHRWRDELDETECDQFERHAGVWLETLGYPAGRAGRTR